MRRGARIRQAEALERRAAEARAEADRYERAARALRAAASARSTRQPVDAVRREEEPRGGDR